MTFSDYVQRYHKTLCPELSRAACVKQLLTNVLKNPETLPPDCVPAKMDSSRLNKYYNGTNGLKGPAPYWLSHIDSAQLEQDFRGRDNPKRQKLCELFSADLPNLRPSTVPARLSTLLVNIIQQEAEYQI